MKRSLVLIIVAVLLLGLATPAVAAPAGVPEFQEPEEIQVWVVSVVPNALVYHTIDVATFTNPAPEEFGKQRKIGTRMGVIAWSADFRWVVVSIFMKDYRTFQVVDMASGQWEWEVKPIGQPSVVAVVDDATIFITTDLEEYNDPPPDFKRTVKKGTVFVATSWNKRYQTVGISIPKEEYDYATEVVDMASGQWEWKVPPEAVIPTSTPVPPTATPNRKIQVWIIAEDFPAGFTQSFEVWVTNLGEKLEGKVEISSLSEGVRVNETFVYREQISLLPGEQLPVTATLTADPNIAGRVGFEVKVEDENGQILWQTDSQTPHTVNVWWPEVLYSDGISAGSEYGNKISLMDIDGAYNLVIPTEGNSINPRWSPDGSEIVFSSDKEGNWEIYTMELDGLGQTRLTHNEKRDDMPVWSSDGKIAFTRHFSGEKKVFLINADGSGEAICATCSQKGNQDFPFFTDDGRLIVSSSENDSRSSTPFEFNQAGSDVSLSWRGGWRGQQQISVPNGDIFYIRRAEEGKKLGTETIWRADENLKYSREVSFPGIPKKAVIWDPSANKKVLLFAVRLPDGNFDIYKKALDDNDSSPVNLTHRKGYQAQGVLRPGTRPASLIREEIPPAPMPLSLKINIGLLCLLIVMMGALIYMNKKL